MEQNVRIDKEIHAIAADYCIKKGMKLGKYTTNALREKLIKEGVIKELENTSMLPKRVSTIPVIRG